MSLLPHAGRPVPVDGPSEVVAIDGPAGAGKSTVARALAKALGWAHLDTGAMFRAITLRLLDVGQVPAADGRAANDAELARTLAALELVVDESGRVLLDGVDVGARIREPRVDAAVSAVAANPAVRIRLLEAQRAFARSRPTVAEGRDLGTVVFPSARWKVWLDASLAERARRRTRELRERGGGPNGAQGHADLSEAEVARAMERRDHADSSRAHAPLEQARDAVTVDTTGLSIEQVVERLVSLVRTGQSTEATSA